jgi:hypothetical protein
MPAPTETPSSDRLVIEFASETSGAERTAYLARNGLETVETLTALNSVVVISSSAEIPLADALVMSVQSDAFVHAQMTPNDPFYDQQWWLKAANIPLAWDHLPNSMPTVTVAVIDSGVC